MSFVTVDELVAARKKNPSVEIYTYDTTGQYARVPSGELDAVKAEDILAAIRKATLANYQYKLTRPWSLVNMSDKLDPEQAWMGFEFETGWDNHRDYERAMAFLIDKLDHVAVDREGTGSYVAEITFPPENFNDYTDGKASIQKFYDHLYETDNRMASSLGYAEYAGTHVNISTPAWRKNLMSCRSGSLLGRLNHSLQCVKDKRKVFGRTPYGYGYSRGDTQGNSWIEFKLFLSKPTREEFEHYVSVSQRLAVCIERMAQERDEIQKIVNGCQGPYISNMQQYLLGETEELVWGDRYNSVWKAAA